MYSIIFISIHVRLYVHYLLRQPADSDISCCRKFIPSSAAAAAPATACSDIWWRPQPAAGYDPGRDSAPMTPTLVNGWINVWINVRWCQYM